LLCPQCETNSRTRPQIRWIGEAGEVPRILHCLLCGVPLSPDPETEWLLRTLARLGRFGLAAEDRPILAERR
jgi:hypothetical protein